jgi:hypothetical protein
MKRWSLTALLGAAILGLGLQSQAASELSWLKGARLVINGGPCQGTFTVDLSRGPETATLGEPAETTLALKGTACAQPPELVVTSSDHHLYAVSVDYRAEAPVAPVAGFVLYLKAPAVAKVHASYVPSKIIYMWVEPFWTDRLDKLPAETEYALWQNRKGEYGAALPLVGGGHRAALQGENNEVKVIASDYNSSYVPRRVPLLAWGHGPDPYRLTDELYAFALPAMGAKGKLRREKAWPEMFNYLGWCSWNAYYRNITEDKIVAHAKHFQEAGLPFRWIIIDDGWQPLDKVCSTFRPCVMHLTGFEAVPDRFPGGLAQTVSKVKSYGITWVGVWHTINGYWNGIALDSELGRKEKDALLPVDQAAAFPDFSSDRGQRFYDDYYAFLKGAGVDFVKVDNQCSLAKVIKGKDNLAPVADGVAQELQNYEAAAAKYFNSAAIDCMSQNIEGPFGWSSTNDSRNSIDYVPLFPTQPRVHTLRNVFNALWYSQLTWADYDMFQTHENGAMMHAVARAISGGPVYVTDKLNREKPEFLWPLVFSDGRVLRVDSPALPTRDVLLENMRVATVPLKAFAPVGNSGVVAAWNVNYLNLPVRGTVSPADCEGLQGGQFAVYEHFSGKLETLGSSEKIKISLRPFGVRLYVMVPIEDGFAAIGLCDKFISPRAIRRENREAGKIEIELVEGGKFVAYAEKEPQAILVNGAKLAGEKISYQGRKLALDLRGIGKGPVQLSLAW